MKAQNAPGFWQKNRLIIKAFFIGILVLALLIPTFIIMYLVNERKERKQEVTREISKKWSPAQTVTGPFLNIPYKELVNGTQINRYLEILPDQLSINGQIEPEIRYRSIFKIPVFTAKPLVLSGKFSSNNIQSLGIQTSSLLWNEAKLCIGISDLKGILEQSIKWNGQALTMNTGLPNNMLAYQGIHGEIKIDSSFQSNEYSFSIQLILRGSEQMFFTPLGSSTDVHLSSNWENVSFDGHYLPNSEKISKDHFEADWKISPFNRDFPKLIMGNETAAESVKQSAFGVILLSPFDAYAQTMRALKYAILIIALTFFVYFFTEIFKKRPVHPLQYILIGMALVIFYTLLLSLSEYIIFPYAYLIAAAATVILLGWYTQSLFKTGLTSLVFCCILSLLYLFIYILIQMQDNALLIGSIGLFGLLTGAMYISRKIDWYRIKS